MDENTLEADALESLLEYRYAGKTWLLDGKEPTVFAFLRKRGLPLPSGCQQPFSVGSLCTV